MRIIQSRAQITLAANTSYNSSQTQQIKGFRSDSGGQVDYTDESGTSHSIVLLPGEIPPIGGNIYIENSTSTDLLIFL
jgi:hypothetical protein